MEELAAYDSWYGHQDSPWLDQYHHSIYAFRSLFSREDPQHRIQSKRPYPDLPPLLRQQAEKVRYAIATAKDRRSVEAVLRRHGLDDLFPADLLFDKEPGKSKDAHLREIRKRLDLPFSELNFIDDKVNLIDAVAPMGVRCALAGWGYNGPREIELARSRGYVVCMLDDLDQTLFGVR